MKVLMCGVELAWCELPAVVKGVPGLSYQLAQMWDRRGRGVMGLERCQQSDVKNRVRLLY